MSEQTAIEGWAILDLSGHQQCAGYVSTTMLGTTALLRVDVPEVDACPAYTRFFGPGAIYGLVMVSEEIVRAAARQYSMRPTEILALVPRQLTAPAQEDEDVPWYQDEDE